MNTTSQAAPRDHITSRSIRWDKGTAAETTHRLIAEEPLSIRIQGKPYSVVMRTPGDELAHAAGFCLAEGIVEKPEDFAAIGFCDEIDGNIVTVTLNPAARKQSLDIIERRGFVSQTSCGVCGKELLQDLFQIVHPLGPALPINLPAAVERLHALGDLQPLRDTTGASHAAAIYNTAMDLLTVAEDVGRHNALDKAIGRLFLEKRLSHAAFIVLSSRISFELVQKAARAHIPVLFALSKPTALAVDLAKRLDMALVCKSKKGGVTIFCGKNRISLPDNP